MRGRLVTYIGAALSVLAAVLAARWLGVLPALPGGGPQAPDTTVATYQAEPEPSFPEDGPARIAAVFEAGGTPVIRTDFGDDASWEEVLAQASEPLEGYEPFLVPVEYPDFAGLTTEGLVELLTEADQMNGYVVLADARAVGEAGRGAEVTVDYVDVSPYAVEDAELFETFPGNTFRCTASAAATVETNLAIANVDFSDFKRDVDADGVFHGDLRSG